MSDAIARRDTNRSLLMSWLQMVIAGLVTGFLAVMFSVSDAAFIFSGSLSRFLPVGIAIALASTAILAVITGLTSSIRGVIALPQEVTVASLATIAASVALGMPFAVGEEQKLATIICAIAVASVATGLFLLALGIFRLGRLIRFVPMPVVGGFLAGMGCLIFFGSFGVATGIAPSLDAMHALMLPHAIAKSTFAIAVAAALWFATERAGSPLAAPAVIVLAIVLFHAIGQITGYGLDELAAAGWFPVIPDGELPWPPLNISDLARADWGLIAAHSFIIATMMLVTAMAILMNVSSIEMANDSDADIEREFTASGLANVASGGCGGIAGFQGILPTLLNLKIGGDSRYAGLLIATLSIASMLFGGDLLVMVPLPVFGGLLLWVAATMLKQWLVDTYHQLSGGEYAVIVLMTLIINAAGFVEGLITGLVAGIVLFAVDYSRVDIVKTRLTGETFHSKRALSKDWRAVLAEHGSSIVILRLQGFIFFGTAHQFVERIRRHISENTNTPMRFLVLDLRRTTGLDSSAAISFVKLEQIAAASKFKLVLTDVPHQVAETLERAGLGSNALTPVRWFEDLDHGLQWCEEKLVYRIAPELAEISSVSIMDGLVDDLFADQAAQKMLQYMQQIDLKAGDLLIEQDTESQDMYFIESGILTVLLRTSDGHTMRLGTAEPGSFVGEISFYVGHRRSASVVCERPARVWQLSHERLSKLQKEHPEVASHFHQRMAVIMADRLSANTRLIQHLVD